MRDLFHLPSASGASDVQIFLGNNTAEGTDWITWQKPRGKSMIHILLAGKGANGGSGVVGANSTAAGGGGGGSGGQVSLIMPLSMLPDLLYLSLMGVCTGNQLRSFITIAPKLTAGAGAPAANDTLMMAYGGTVGGNAAGATAGAAGAAGAISTVGLMPIGFAFCDVVLAGQAGIIGGTTVAGAALTLPLTGLIVTGGTGGGGLPAAAAVGTTGGSFTVAGSFPLHASPASVATATVPPGPGASGYQPIPKLAYFYGGLGSGSTHGTATGAGLVQAPGGNGGPGCGGGGMGGALTGSAVAAVSQGGQAIAIITCW
jgi:hypothetical protein